MKSDERIVVLTKTISRILPHYFSEHRPKVHRHFERLLEKEVISIDLAHLFWGAKLDELRLGTLVAAADFQTPQHGLPAKRQLDLQAIRQLPRAKSVLASVPDGIPSARDLLFAYRVLSRCVSLASEFEVGFRLHVSRGVVLTDIDQYAITSILRAAETPDEDPLGKCIGALLDSAQRNVGLDNESAKIHVINLRNDGEFFQAAIVASLFKRKHRPVITILDASGANEQFNFGEWTSLFNKYREELSAYFDYFLPRQDYKASLRVLVQSLCGDSLPDPSNFSNLIALSDAASKAKNTVTVPSMDEAFRHYIEHSPVFDAFGERTLLARLAPTRCHWSGCSFCTINSQHPLPQGLTVPDARLREHMLNLFDVIRRKRIASVILMDEALHPDILQFLAQSIIDNGLSILYRARARFSNAFTRKYCEMLYRSGCRYLGMGLEAASPRVNALINKHRGAEIDYRSVLDNMDAVGIRAHVYAILGFPSETRSEIQATFEFLASSIEKYNYLTVSPNLFFLMRGSGMAQHPESFGLEIHDSADSVGLVLGFRESEHDANLTFARDAVRRIHQKQFLPNVDDPEFAEEFWHFVDQTGIFYLQKVMLSINPYKDIGLNTDIALSLDAHVSASDLFWLKPEQDSDDWLLCDWVTNNFCSLPSFMKAFFETYDESLSLQENIGRSIEIKRREIAEQICRILLENGFLPSKTEELCLA